MKSLYLDSWRFTIVNAKTKKAQSMIEKYENYEGVSLRDVYGSFSWRKEDSYLSIKELRRKFNGWGLVITSHNTCSYSCAFRCHYAGREWLLYFTAYNNYAIEYED